MSLWKASIVEKTRGFGTRYNLTISSVLNLKTEELHQLQDDSKVEVHVRKIYEQYFGDAATEPVNLPVNIVQSIGRLVGKFSSPHSGIREREKLF
jgi:hypothetical protein